MSSEFIRKVFERDREARASIASYRAASIGFAFASIANLFILVVGLSMDPIVIDYLSIIFSVSCSGLFFLCYGSFKKAKQYKLNLKNDPHKYIRFRPPYPWHWWFSGPVG